MTNPLSNDQEQRLARRLEREARATRPAFSEVLHARIRQAIEREAAPRPRRSSAPRVPRRRLFAAVAAALVVGAALLAWWRSRPEPGQPKPLAHPSAPQAPSEDPDAALAKIPEEVPEAVAGPGAITGPTGEIARHFGLLADAAVSEGQWAYLDHDLGVALRLLADQFPLDGGASEPL
jgi:hypothetical protein